MDKRGKIGENGMGISPIINAGYLPTGRQGWISSLFLKRDVYVCEMIQQQYLLGRKSTYYVTKRKKEDIFAKSDHWNLTESLSLDSFLYVEKKYVSIHE